MRLMRRKRMKAELINVFNAESDNLVAGTRLCIQPQSMTELYAMNVWLEQNKMTAGKCVQVDTSEIDNE